MQISVLPWRTIHFHFSHLDYIPAKELLVKVLWWCGISSSFFIAKITRWYKEMQTSASSWQQIHQNMYVTPQLWCILKEIELNSQTLTKKTNFTFCSTHIPDIWLQNCTENKGTHFMTHNNNFIHSANKTKPTCSLTISASLQIVVS